jgi:hypothetical protein
MTTQQFRKAGFALRLGAAALLMHTALAAGEIKGIVTGPDGSRVEKAFVTVQRQPGATPFNASARTAEDGSFSVSGVPDGSYRLCVQVRSGELLDPCQWSATTPVANLSQGRAADLGEIRLAKGYRLRVKVRDAAAVLTANEGKTAGAHLLVGVWRQDGLFVPMRAAGKDAEGKNYELLVPYDTPLTLSAQSKAFNLADEAGAPVDKAKGASVAVEVPSGGATKTYVFNVTGISSVEEK